MNKLIYIILGALIGTVAYSCAMGGKSLDFNDLAKRNNINSFWMKCDDGDTKNVCRKVCDFYIDNKCQKSSVIKLDVSVALDDGYVLMSGELFLNLLRGKY